MPGMSSSPNPNQPSKHLVPNPRKIKKAFPCHNKNLKAMTGKKENASERHQTMDTGAQPALGAVRPEGDNDK